MTMGLLRLKIIVTRVCGYFKIYGVLKNMRPKYAEKS